jgi:hypothetical protein
MIKELNELVWYARRAVWRADELLAFLCNHDVELLRLYSALQAQAYRSDEEAARHLGIGLTSFKKYGAALRRHLKEMVVFFNDEKAGVDLTVKNIFEGARELAVMRMLAWRSCHVAGKAAAMSLLRRGLQYEWPEYVVEATAVLKDMIVRMHGDAAEYAYYDRLSRQYQAYLETERLCIAYYQQIKIQSRGRVARNEALAQQIFDILEQLTPFVHQTASYFFHLYYYTLRNHYFIQKADYVGLNANCAEAIRFFSTRAYPVVTPTTIFYYTKVVGHTMLGQYEAGVLDAEKSLQIPEEGTPNWFSALEAYVYLAFHTRHYEKAFALYRLAYGHRRRAALQTERQEIWHIIGAYCHILRHLTDLPAPEGFPKFKSRQFLNNIQNFSRDKTGMYVAVLIANVLLKLVEEREDELYALLQTLEKYRSRHLRPVEGAANRSVAFIKILAALPSSGYQKATFLRKIQPAMRILESAPLQLANQAHELEIVPFEHLAGWIAAYLGAKRRKKRL